MAEYSPENTPDENLTALARNPYPGRLLVVGYVEDTWVQAYAVEGRSEGSRNRRLVQENDIVSTEVADPSLPVGDPELTIYDAMRSVGGVHIVSNGNQTDRVVRYLRSGKTVEEALDATDHEPDAPNYTPRITGFHDLRPNKGQPFFGLSVISKNPDGDGSVRKLYTDDSPELGFDRLDPNHGYCVHTYKGDGDPLPSFNEAPFRLPVFASSEYMAGMLWESLNRENRVAVAAKSIDIDGVVEIEIINRHT